MANTSPVPLAVRIRRQRILARVQKCRAKKRSAREAAELAAKQARKAARHARLVARRAALGLPMPGTPASRQKAYRERRKAKGLDPYSARELAEQATRKAIEEAKYENQVPGAVIDTWFAPAMDQETALAYIRQHIVPAQPQVAEKYLEQVREQCWRHGLSLNRYTLKPDGVENARIFRALTWQQNGGKSLSWSWNFAQIQSTNDLPKDRAARALIFEASQVTIGNGGAIAGELQLGLV
jgi:hypothetical protein